MIIPFQKPAGIGHKKEILYGTGTIVEQHGGSGIS
jgi:hypothetical protein